VPSPVAAECRADPAAGTIRAKHNEPIKCETSAGALVGEQSRQSLSGTFVSGICFKRPRHAYHRVLKGIYAGLEKVEAILFGFGEQELEAVTQAGGRPLLVRKHGGLAVPVGEGRP
jgi:methionine salvage enolase-phosphatase E1